MSVETIRMALGRLQDEPENEVAWNDLAEGITAPGDSAHNGEIERLLGRARARHEHRREWDAVARLLDLELSFVSGTAVEAPMQAELARIFHEELFDADRAAAAYRRLLQVRPDDGTATQVLEEDEAKRARWRDVAQRYLDEADEAADPSFKSSLLVSAADVTWRYGKADAAERAKVLDLVEQALAIDKKNKRAAALGEIASAAGDDWENVARLQAVLLAEAPLKEDRIAAGLRLGRTCAKRLADKKRATHAYEQVLDLVPGQPDALAYLAETYSAAEDWDHLVALYEDQLRGGNIKPADEQGILVQIAMVHWRMRGNPAAAEPYFDRVRRVDPTHAGMLGFFRELLTERSDKTRLVTILTDAQRALPDGADKRALSTEIAKLAESQENAQKAIEQYKSVLRTDPDNREARDALKRLYALTDGHNALVELYRQDLERTPATDVAGRATVLREIAAIYRDRIKNDAALVTVLSQLVQVDDKDVEAVRELVRVYESLGRWRDLLAQQQHLAALTDNAVEKANLLRAAARRWLDQFSNVQNALAAYEALVEVLPTDEEAQGKLKELYQKRRAWPQLYALYEKQLGLTEGPARIELLGEMAKLAAERLDRGTEAIALQKKILELDPQAPGVFDALEKQAEREKDFATVAEVLEKRVDASGDDQTRLVVLQKLGAVYAERLKDPAAAARTWRRVLALSPGHAKALRVLRESYAAAGDWDGLEELYASQNDNEGLVDFLSSAADKSTDGATKVDLSFRVARVFEQRLSAPERATRSYERILSVSPADVRAASALAPIYEKEEKWARLPALYEILLGNVPEDEIEPAIELLRKLATVTGGPLADKATALGWARKAYELAPDHEGLELLEAWSRAAGSWGAFVEAVEARLKKKKGLTKELRRSLRLKLAELYARELGKIDEAVAAYRELVEGDPTDAETVKTFDALLRERDRKDDLRWLFGLRVEQVEGEARAAVLAEWAALEEEVFSDPAQAITLYRKVVDLVPRNGDALRALSRLLMAQADYEGAAEIVARHRDVSEGADRARREVELATIHIEHLDKPKDAFDAAVRALQHAPHDADAIAILSRLVERPETRLAAAQVLEEEYAEAGDARREGQALRVMLEAEDRAEVRRELFQKLADVEERKLSAAGNAFDVVLRALNEYPDDLTLWDRSAELAQRSGRPTDLAEAYRVHLVGAQRPDGGRLPEATEIELCERAASLHDEQLGDPEGAMPYLERVLRVDPNNSRAFGRLKQILTGAERWSELEALYDRAAQGTTDERARVELLNEVALIAEEIMGDAARAIGYYERILSLDPVYASALDALEKLYERESRWADLAALLEKRLDRGATEQTVDAKLMLGRIYIEKLLEPDKAIQHLDDVLRDRDGDAEARQLVERLLDITTLRQRAARILEVVYETRDEIRSLVRVLDIRREGATDDGEKRDLLRRVSVLRDERLKDDAGAFAALAELVPLEPEDASARERLVEIGRRLGEHDRVATVLTTAADTCPTPGTRGEILMEVARICEDLLSDTDRAEKVYRRILTIDPNDGGLVVPAAKALASIYAAATKPRELAEVLGIQVKLEDDVEVRRGLHERIGTLYEETLDEPAKAIEAWRARLGDEPADATALTALERLYERTKDWRELVGVLHSKEQASSDGDERRRTMTKIARVLADEIGDPPEAINAWRAVLDEFGPERPTLAALAALYDKAERWQDLAETLEVDLSLADDVDDRLGLLARLGNARRLHLDDLPGALDAYRQALALDATATGGAKASKQALEAMLELPDARREAAETLRPLYEADGDAEKLLKVLEIEIETSHDPGERLEKLEAALRTAEGPLTDPARAFGYGVRGVREAVGEADIGKWIDTIERLAEATDRWAELCELYHACVGDILDGDVQQRVELRVGDLYRHKLGDRPHAIEHYKKALETRGDDRRAMIALEELYREGDEHEALLGILKLRVDNAESDAEKKALLFAQAELSADKLGDKAGAIATYEALLDVELDPKAIRALEGLYRGAERWGDLIALYERQLDGKVGVAADLRVQIAQTARRQTGDVSRAFDELGEALTAEPGHAGAVAELESFLGAADDAEHRARAGEMLEPVYLRRADWSKVKSALDARLEASQDPAERRELLTRLATLHEEQLEDYKAALETVAKLLHEDLSEESVWHELERLAKVAGAERRLAEIYAAELGALAGDDAGSAKLCRRTGELYADLGEVEPALTWYRRAHEFEPESRELFDAIDRLLSKENRHSERVALFRTGLDYLGGSERLDALHTIARLERDELGLPEKAIETYRAALDVDDQDVRALDALTELYRQLGSHRELAELYLQRAESATSGEAAAPYRLALARLSKDKLDDVPAAIDQLEAIVTDVPWQKDAIAELEALTRMAEHKARVVEILRPLYERADDWRHLIRLNEERFGLAQDTHEKVAVLRETAKLWETRGNDRDRALAATRAAFDLDAEDGDTRGELERLAELLGAWDELAESYEHGIESTTDELVKRELLGSLAKVYDERLDDPRSALVTYSRLSKLDPTDPTPLDAMDTLAVLLSDWHTLIRVLEHKSESASDAEAASLFRRTASVKLDMLEDEDGAITAYERSLELDADSAPTADALIALYEPRKKADRLVELYGRRVELAGADEAELRYDLNVRAAACHENELDSPRDAIAALSAALDARPGDATVLKSLERLFRAEKMWDELLDNLKLQASAASDKEARVALRTAIGDLYAGELDNPDLALEQYRLVLDEAADSAHAVKAVRNIGETREELRVVAAEILEPVLRARGSHADLVAVLEMRLRAQTEPAERAATLMAIARVLDVDLGRTEAAEEALLRALDDTPDDAELHGEIERLAARGTGTQGWEKYCDALAHRAGAIFDASITKDLLLRLGRIAEDKLGDDKRSVDAYAKAMESAGDAPELLEALDRLYGRLGDKRALADVLERRVAVVSGDREQADLLHRLAKIQIDAFADKALGLSTLKQALDRAPDHAEARASLEALTDERELFEEAAEALETVYRGSGDNAALARLYEKRINFAPSAVERLRMRLDLARVLEERSNDPKAAQGVLEGALADDPTDSDVLAEIERVAAITTDWASASGALEKAVRSQTDLASDTATDLWMRLAGWRKEKMGDRQAAEHAYEEALRHDPHNEVILRAVEDLQRAPGRERELVGTLRRLAALDALGGVAADLRREAKVLSETQLSDVALTEAILREMIAADDADAWAIAELTSVREKAGDWKEVYGLYVRNAELVAEASEIRRLRHAAALVAKDHLSDAPAAIGLYEQIFEDEPSDEKASAALRELYAKSGKSKELLALLVRLVDLADTPAARSTLRLEMAALCLDKLSAPSEAAEHLRAVLDEEPGNEQATLMLSQLLEKQGRDDELAELLDRQIELMRDRGDVAAELSFRVRLGEVFESRLGDTAKAIGAYQAVLDRDGAHKGALVALARLHEAKGEKAEAAKMLERLLEGEQGAEAVATSLRLADLYGALKDVAALRRALERGLQADERAAEVRDRLRSLYEKEGAWTELADLVRGDAEAASETNERVRLFRRAAEIHQSKRHDPAAAADLLVKASELAPGDRDLLLLLCDAYSASGRGRQAADALQKIVESYGGRRSKDLATIHHRLAKAYSAEGDKDKALAELDIAFKIDPGSIGVLRDLGVLSLELSSAATDDKVKEGHLDRAQKTFRALLLQKLDDSSPISKAEVFYYLADISHRQGDDKKAQQMLERALDNDKNHAPSKELLAKLKK